MKRLPKIVVIAGPTASGKTSLSVELAEVFNAEIISADSMQVYRWMDIGTAKPTEEERKGIPHHLLDIVDPDEPFNAALYRSLAHSAAMEVLDRGKLCLVVGGTGLYIKSLLQGLFECPPAIEEIRQSLHLEWESDGAVDLYKRLEFLDPERAMKVHPNDRVRIVRALEIIGLTKRRPSELNREHRFGERSFDALKFCLQVERKRLYQRIDERCVEMVDRGLVAETEELLRKGYNANLKSMEAIGYRQAVRYLRNEYTLEQAISNLQRDTRRYAKRQLTWFRKDPENVWLDPGNFDAFVEGIRAFIA
ncbi:MAG: tRNA (adenosine(37)-N6)-dimethylallyltransferase MiaA [Desulfatiglandaceae bacterium]|jgi:tRNA dimethylallyltransferase